MKMRTIIAAAAVLCLAAGCVKEEQGIVDAPAGGENEIFADAPKIMAELSEPETRTCIEAAADATGKLPMLWEESDAVGVFFADGSSNAKYVNISGKNPNASFGAAEQVSGSEIAYVYYPYDAANNGQAATALSGNVPSEQAMDGSIHGDYKWGELKSQVEEGYKFKFHNLFSLVRFNINAEGTVLAGETLESVTLTVTRNGEAVPVTGDFTFRADDGSYYLETTSNVLKTTWNQALSVTLSSFASVFPEIKSGDQLTFVLETTNYKATLTVTSKATFAPETYYTFPLTLSKLSGLTIVKKVSGTFTAATLNVDGLPSIANPEGPGKSGTQNISLKIATANWDIIGFSEDFEYHSALTGSLSDYTFGKHRGSVGFSQIFGSVADTDGLGFATKKSTCSFATETNDTFIPFNDAYGGLSNGANTCIKKGIRHYVVTMAEDGVQIDVIITHMNTYEDGDGKPAQLSQLDQIAEYINMITSVANPRPVIFMGDTNCRYTRHDFSTNFFGKLNSNISYVDPWIEFHRGGVYPKSGTKSLMIRSNYKGDTTNDIVCSDDQRGEVVDKIIYFNVEGAAIKIKAESCYNDIENFTKSKESASYSGVTAEDANGNILEDQDVTYTRCVGYADHFPVVAKFTYTGTQPLK